MVMQHHTFEHNENKKARKYIFCEEDVTYKRKILYKGN
jgi:hypothetical protein